MKINTSKTKGIIIAKEQKVQYQNKKSSNSFDVDTL